MQAEAGQVSDEVKNLLLLEDGQNCRATRQLAERKLALIEERIDDLTRMLRILRQLIVECAAGRHPRSCPIITSLAADAKSSV